MPTILIVDDSSFQHQFLKSALDGQGYEILAANDGFEALERLAVQDVDCIVADLIMPRMRGMDLLKALREKGSQTPVVILTADIQEHVREACLRLGARIVLHKPVKPELLRRTLADVLGQEPR